MKIISWNVRGLGCALKRRSVRSFLSINKVDIIILQETKSQEWSSRFAESCWGYDFDEWKNLNAVGSAGGQCIGWNSGKVNLLDSFQSKFFLTVRFRVLKDDSELFVSSVYGPPYLELREEFWDEFRNLEFLKNFHWVLGGDFNVTRFSNERKGNRETFSDSSNFNDVIRSFNLVDFPLLDGRYTWSNHRLHPSMARLDRFLVSSSLDSEIPNSTVRCLASDISDHVPILLDSQESLAFKKRFCFEKMWLLEEEFSKFVNKLILEPSLAKVG